MVEAFGVFLDEHFGGSEESKDNGSTTDVAKSINEEQKLFTGIVLRPNVVDAHGDIYDEVVVEKACHDYVEFCMNQNLQHSIDVEKGDVSVVESYVAPADFQLGEGDVLKGDWIMTVKVHNDTVWDMCKAGDFTGFSVGCSAYAIKLEDSDE